MPSSLAARRAARRPDLEEKLRHMALPLHPLVQVDTGRVHPAFPASVLHFWLLTDDQLDALAHFYHQRTPGRWSSFYPCPVVWPRDGLSLEDKRRKLGRFIGLRGCETPLLLPASSAASLAAVSPPSSGGSAAPLCVNSGSGCGPCTLDAEPLCYACSMRVVAEVFGTVDRAAAATTSTASTTTTTTTTTPPRESPRMLTVDDVLESARLARLAHDASEEALRYKLGYYR